MGMESYFFTLEVKCALTPDTIRRAFENKYSVSKYSRPSGCLFKRRVVDDDRFVIDKKAVVDIASVQETIKVVFELCFSNFERNLGYIFDVSKWVSSFGSETKLTVLNSQCDFDMLDIDGFKAVINREYSEKLRLFRDEYGETDEDILPHDFYDGKKRKRY
ncbi:MAG: hypothetical protein IJL83_04535 [Clostridia bacterium]|nr:hypothetical protein [Clostridia bacterium]